MNRKSFDKEIHIHISHTRTQHSVWVKAKDFIFLNVEQWMETRQDNNKPSPMPLEFCKTFPNERKSGEEIYVRYM